MVEGTCPVTHLYMNQAQGVEESDREEGYPAP